MAWDDYRTIIDDLGILAEIYGYTPLLTYCYMGEPFLAEDLGRYIHYARQKKIKVYLNTNASPMTPAKVDNLLKSGFDGKIHISVHGATPSTYERITGLNYEQTLHHIQYLLSKYDRGKVVIRGVNDGWPVEEVTRWHEIWEPKGVQVEYLKPISRCGSVKRLFHGASDAQGAIRLYGCKFNHPLVEMVVLFNGQAVMCCQDMGREVNWGNVLVDGIEAVWNGPIRRRLVEKLYNGELIEGDFICRRCEQALHLAGMVQNIFSDSMRKTGQIARRTVRSLVNHNPE